MKKIYKVIEQANGKLTIYGSNRDIQTFYKKPEWAEEEETAFKYNGRTYFLSEFTLIARNGYPDWLQEFHGVHNDTYFSGILVKVSDCGEAIKAYTFVS